MGTHAVMHLHSNLFESIISLFNHNGPLFQDSSPSPPSGLNLSEAHVPSSNYASTTEGIIESGPYRGTNLFTLYFNLCRLSFNVYLLLFNLKLENPKQTKKVNNFFHLISLLFTAMIANTVIL